VIQRTERYSDLDVILVHIIGLVGVGKTYFIQHHFPQKAIIFDIKDAYELYHFSPNDLKDNTAAYEQFKQAIDGHIDRLYHEIINSDLRLLLIESTGTNRAMNSVLYKYRPYKIWIEPDIQRMDNQYLRERPYAGEINKYVLKKWQKGEIQCNNRFDPKTNEYENPIPIEVAKFLI
jgi:hypothetical protein